MGFKQGILAWTLSFGVLSAQSHVEYYPHGYNVWEVMTNPHAKIELSSALKPVGDHTVFHVRMSQHIKTVHVEQQIELLFVDDYADDSLDSVAIRISCDKYPGTEIKHTISASYEQIPENLKRIYKGILDELDAERIHKEWRRMYGY